MSRRRHKKTPVIQIVPPARPPDVLEWDQKLSTLAFAVNDVAITHRKQMEAAQEKQGGADFSVGALQETLEQCRKDREELAERSLMHERIIRSAETEMRELYDQLEREKETLEQCRKDREELAGIIRAERTKHREFISGVKEILERGVIN